MSEAPDALTEDTLKTLEEMPEADLDEHKDGEPSATDTMIAEATAAAIEAAAIDVSAATNAAVLAASAASLVDAADVPDSIKPAGTETDETSKKNAERRKRYREKSLEDEEDEEAKKLRGPPVNHDDQLASRRLKDRQRYAGMTPEQRQAYNTKRREQYHRQSEISRQRRRERERNRYHALDPNQAKGRNARRAKLERERYNKLSGEALEAKNRRRRERAALARQKKESEKAASQGILVDAPVVNATVAEEAQQVVAEVIGAAEGKPVEEGEESIPKDVEEPVETADV